MWVYWIREGICSSWIVVNGVVEVSPGVVASSSVVLKDVVLPGTGVVVVGDVGPGVVVEGDAYTGVIVQGDVVSGFSLDCSSILNCSDSGSLEGSGSFDGSGSLDGSGSVDGPVSLVGQVYLDGIFVSSQLSSSSDSPEVSCKFLNIL